MTLYIDSDMGSMRFAFPISIIGTAFYSLRMLLAKFCFRLSGVKTKASQKKAPILMFSHNKRHRNVFDPICREVRAEIRSHTGESARRAAQHLIHKYTVLTAGEVQH